VRCKSESGFPFTYGLPVTRTSFNRTFNRTTVTCTIRVYLIEISLWGGNMVSYATLSLSRKIDSLYNWRPLSASSTSTGQFVTNDGVRSRTGQPLLSDTVRSRHLSFFGHLNRAGLHYGPSPDRRRRPGRPRHSWLRTVETDLRPLNLGLASVSKATHAGQSGMAATRGNGNVDDKLLKEQEGSMV